MSHESNDWFGHRLFFSRYSKIGLKIILSKILPHIGNRETDRLFGRSYLSPFLWIATFYFFQLLGKDPFWKQFLKIIGRVLTIEESYIFSNLIDISYPCALLIFKVCIILRISWLFNEINDKLALVTGVLTRGKVLFLETSVHWDAKKTLKRFFFLFKVWCKFVVD